jgi:hypothetical protein
MTDLRTVKQAIEEKDSILSFEFQEEKNFSSYVGKTDRYGHIEVDLESFFAAAEADVQEDDTIQKAREKIYNTLLKFEEKQKEENKNEV